VVEQKGLKQDALGFVSSVVIGVASTAPGYSLAAVLTLVVAMLLWRGGHPDFFRRKRETAAPGTLEVPPPMRPAETAGIA
jgi:hypothetical protein